MILIPKEKWFLDTTKPVIECPQCEGLNLGDTAPHGVRENGEVFQSVICGHPPCDFHDYVKLEGWNYGIVPHS